MDESVEQSQHSQINSKSKKKTVSLPSYVSHPVLLPSASSGTIDDNRLSQTQSGEGRGTWKPVEWMEVPEVWDNCTSGLEYLSQVDQVLLHQQRELIEAFDSMSCTRKFQLKNSMGKMMYFATQTNIYQSANFRGYQQGFEMNIYDHSKREVIHLIQPFICSLIFCSWNIQQMEVQAPVGVVAGYVKETHHPTTYRFTIHDSAGETALFIKGQCQGLCFRRNANFDIFDRTWKSKIGTISTQYFLDNFGDTLSIQFPKDLDVKLKAVILGASILIENKF
ncbi:phospholipid scramblase 2-like [Erpetoichthys calabaricus]|uniref:phospholipid scramblase 2-like n=1 Tax=Erpetoichthys calabaricus TaxID=27687 RepID=UPI0022348F15|nr:phospholipid scramblase 2-like [Erpetoichthys calabaricus]